EKVVKTMWSVYLTAGREGKARKETPAARYARLEYGPDDGGWLEAELRSGKGLVTGDRGRWSRRALVSLGRRAAAYLRDISESARVGLSSALARDAKPVETYLGGAAADAVIASSKCGHDCREFIGRVVRMTYSRCRRCDALVILHGSQVSIVAPAPAPEMRPVP
ncbi:MAG: hypothetical protein ACE5IJ_11730, partial [Thermoplasmata archaeon]